MPIFLAGEMKRPLAMKRPAAVLVIVSEIRRPAPPGPSAAPSGPAGAREQRRPEETHAKPKMVVRRKPTRSQRRRWSEGGQQQAPNHDRVSFMLEGRTVGREKTIPQTSSLKVAVACYTVRLKTVTQTAGRGKILSRRPKIQKILK